ncbi:hypothetical protein CYMTET_43400 [Cymbomonas tetramitiformis]|uniref:Uncharacterized protein n=1 Tax=Cymbomonas tetramitiformis TaxID=36881 RepID=A0AAE0C4B5_9CHLO|nr:hypothetical protein CYMTET_43400 [Cymbomonas tetramitiformis]
MHWVREEYMAHYAIPATKARAAELPKPAVGDKRKHSLLFDSDDDDADDDDALDVPTFWEKSEDVYLEDVF